MAKKVMIGDRLVGDGEPAYVVGEIGINHNGDVQLAEKLISAAALAGCEAVKFQKRTVEVGYSAEELARPRENPFGQEEYKLIGAHCKRSDVMWFASCWDEASVDFIAKFDPPAFKIASASLTDDNLLKHHRQYGKPIIMSTGMSTEAEVDHAVEVLGTDDLILMHTNSTYPTKLNELNLKCIQTLKERYDVPVGYSGHEPGLATTVASIVLGACIIERHITMDRASWGSDQAASVEPFGMQRLVRDIRCVETALGDGIKRLFDSEVPVKDKLRRK